MSRWDSTAINGLLQDLNQSTTSGNVPPPTVAPTVVNNEISTTSQRSNSNPVGISFMGAKWSEEKLIGYAYAFEQRAKVREKGLLP